MMNEQENVKVVQKMYAAFGQHDLPAVLNTLADDVEWQSPVTRSITEEISWAKLRHSREEVAIFFKELFEKVQPEQLETLELTVQADRVIVEGKNRGTVRSTGRTYEHDWVMVFTLHQGKIARLRHYYDTNDVMVAFRSE
jgi:steroid delta-isomerase-like uncharacterized protein